MEKVKNLVVAYATDDNYSKYLGISMLSLFQKNKDFDGIEVFVLDYGIGDQNKERLLDIGRRYKRKVHIRPVEDILSSLNLNMGARKISIVSYSRLFLASIIPENYEKILYLDCDTIVADSLGEFWDHPLGNFWVAGVWDTVDSLFLEKIGLRAHDKYINAGILLINLKKWREERLEDRFMDFVKSFDGNVPHHDQGVINGVCKDNKSILGARYNVTSNIYTFSLKTIKRLYFMDDYYSLEELEEAKSSPAILHFTTGLVGRPWEANCSHPMKEHYTKIWKDSPWKGEPMLPDGRKISVRVFAWIFKNMPLSISEGIYRSLWKLSHIKG